MPDPKLPIPGLPDSDQLERWLDLGGWPLMALALLVIALLILLLVLKVLRAIRPPRPVQLHARLQKYAGASSDLEMEVAEKRRDEARRIVATSSTESIAGYEIVEQIEAVFVDGFQHPEEALEGLKAASAMKKANAVTNVRLTRDQANKCAAHGDAVIARRIGDAAGPTAAGPPEDVESETRDDNSRTTKPSTDSG